MKRISLSLSAIFFYSSAIFAIEYGVAIPVAYNTQTNEWSVLLGLHQDNQWWPLRTALQKGEQANKAAERALRAGTKGIYDITIQGVPWQQMGNIFYHIVPVKFIRANKLYTKGRTNEVTDFVWLPISKLLVKGPVKPKDNEPYIVGAAFLEAFQTIWPQKVAELTEGKPQQTPAPAGPGPWTPYAPQAESWANIPDAIYFYVKGQPYYELTNFYERNITIDGKIWPTSEQYYQAMKFTDPNLQETIRKFKTDASGSGPRKAFDFARANKQSVRADWQKISLDTMRKAVRAKFTQQADLSKLLLATGNKILVEDAGVHDAFYGAGADYKGQNWLGRILMQLRDELRGQPVQPKVTPSVTKQPAQSSMAPLIPTLQALEQSLNALAGSLAQTSVTKKHLNTNNSIEKKS